MNFFLPLLLSTRSACDLTLFLQVVKSSSSLSFLSLHPYLICLFGAFVCLLVILQLSARIWPRRTSAKSCQKQPIAVASHVIAPAKSDSTRRSPVSSLCAVTRVFCSLLSLSLSLSRLPSFLCVVHLLLPLFLFFLTRNFFLCSLSSCFPRSPSCELVC